MSDARTVAFKKLKPACVSLSKAALSARSSGQYGADLTEAVDGLRRQLLQIGSIDAEIASYAFFPLSHVFHGLKSLPLPLLDLALECVRLLIIQGWTQSREAGLCKQLLVLLSFIIDPSPAANGSKSDFGDVATARALRCFVALFGDAKAFVLCLCHKSKDEALPVLGQAVSSALVTLNAADSFEVQIAAAASLNKMIDALKHEKILQNFFPGIVSGLTKYLQPRSAVRRPYKAIVPSIYSLNTITTSLFRDPEGAVENQDDRRNEWQKQQSSQLQKALTHVLKLKDHEKREVLQALLSLCLDLLQTCKSQLQDISQLMVDVSIQVGSLAEMHKDRTAAELLERTFADDGLRSILTGSLQGWLTALPRLAQSSDPDSLTKHLKNIDTAYNLITEVEEGQTELAKMLVASIENACAIALQRASDMPTRPLETNLKETSALTIAISKDVGTEFQPLGHTKKDHGKMLATLTREIYNLAQSSVIRDEVASRPPSLESLWMAKCSVQSTLSIDTAISEFINSSSMELGPAGDLGEFIYSQALNILSEPIMNTDSDWRAQAIALEIIALTAQTQKEAFAPELVDVLFPVLERIGSSEPEIREHALTCLNILAVSCGASNAGQLVVQNADYLINSVAQRLNVPEISPQTPKVLMMVVQLSGPSLIPYLDDTMNSIFEILDDYHGYYGLVDPLFAVLEAIVGQASAPSSKLIQGSAQKHQVDNAVVVSLSDVEAELKKFSKKIDGLRLDEPATRVNEDTQATDDNEVAKQEEKAPTPSKSYQMIQAITRHCQHYLTHESADLRRRLLDLVATASVALYQSEDQYLPLINDVWPVVIARLEDAEPLVAQAAMRTLSTFFECAGDFLMTRMRDAWPSVLAVGKRLKSQADARNKGKGGRGQFSLALQLVEEFVRMLTYLAESTGMSSEMEDDVFDMLGPYHHHPAARGLLKQVNPDALWLLDVRKNAAELARWNEKLPVCSGFTFQRITC